MGTVAKISVYSSNADLTAAFELCSREFDLVSRTCSLYDPDSELSWLNATAASAPFECSDMMWELLIRAEKAHRESNGYFDITVKPLMDLWGFYRKREQPPSEREIAETMKVIGFDKLILDKQKKTVLFSVPGMALDLGGIAKGYAVDRAYDAINAAGIRAGVIDIGGNLRMLPEPPPGKKFYLVSIRDPHHRESVLPDQLKVAPGKAVSTSGDYERFVVFNNRRYGHIISPKTGSPTTASAVSVIAGTAVDADIYSTSCSLGGEAVAAGIKQEKPETEIIFTR
jgi:thiamine biosynthesis lipoprotein